MGILGTFKNMFGSTNKFEYNSAPFKGVIDGDIKEALLDLRDEFKPATAVVNIPNYGRVTISKSITQPNSNIGEYTAIIEGQDDEIKSKLKKILHDMSYRNGIDITEANLQQNENSGVRDKDLYFIEVVGGNLRETFTKMFEDFKNEKLENPPKKIAHIDDAGNTSTSIEVSQVNPDKYSARIFVPKNGDLMLGNIGNIESNLRTAAEDVNVEINIGNDVTHMEDSLE